METSLIEWWALTLWYFWKHILLNLIEEFYDCCGTHLEHWSLLVISWSLFAQFSLGYIHMRWKILWHVLHLKVLDPRWCLWQKQCKLTVSFLVRLVWEAGSLSVWGNIVSFCFSRQSLRCFLIFACWNFTVAGSTPFASAVALAMANRPQSCPPTCFWHRLIVTWIKLSGPVANGL